MSVTYKGWVSGKRLEGGGGEQVGWLTLPVDTANQAVYPIG